MGAPVQEYVAGTAAAAALCARRDPAGDARMTAHSTLSPPSLREGWRIGLLVLGLLFADEAAAAVRVWLQSTAYSHCFFIVPISLYLAWDRRDRLASVPIVPLPAAALLALPIGAAWLGAQRLGVMEGRQHCPLALVEVLFLTVLGWRMFRALLAPLLYLFFLVPSGAFLTPLLQDFTARFIDVGLTVLSIPHTSTAMLIDIPGGRFYVAEACAGLRFLIASIAFGVLYAVLMYRSTGRRVLFVAASMVIPVVANGFRALGIVVLGYILGSAEAAAADHILYGWVFFSIVILLLVAAGLPFRQDLLPLSRAPTAPVRPDLPRVSVLAALGFAVLASFAPAAGLALDRSAVSPQVPPALAFNMPLGCWPTTAPAAPGVLLQHVDCQRGRFDVLAQVFSPRANPAVVMNALRGATGEYGGGEDVQIDGFTVPGVPGMTWRRVLTTDPARLALAQLWVNGAPARDGLAGRASLARNSVLGSSSAPVMVIVSYPSARPTMSPQETNLALQLLAGFLSVQTDLSDRVAQAAKLAAQNPSRAP